MTTKILIIATIVMLTNFQLSFAATMRHNIREIMTYDVEDMERLVNKEINSKEKNDEIFLNQSAQVLTQTVLVHPRFSERQAALARLKSKMLNEEFVEVMNRGFDILLSILEDKNISPSDEASSLVALTNLVIEARQMRKENFKPMLEKVAQAEIEISDQARSFGREPLKNLISPSLEAKASL